MKPLHVLIFVATVFSLLASVDVVSQPKPVSTVGANSRLTGKTISRATPITPATQAQQAVPEGSPPKSLESIQNDRQLIGNSVIGIALILGISLVLYFLIRKDVNENRDRLKKREKLLSKMTPVEREKFLENERLAKLRNHTKTLTNHGMRLQQAQNTLTEYKRTCRSCGKVWHSLPSRENQIAEKIQTESTTQLAGAMQGCGTCGMCGTTTAAQASHNVTSNQTELQRLRSCPQCSSVNYLEEVIQHANTPAQ